MFQFLIRMWENWRFKKRWEPIEIKVPGVSVIGVGMPRINTDGTTNGQCSIEGKAYPDLRTAIAHVKPYQTITIVADGNIEQRAKITLKEE